MINTDTIDREGTLNPEPGVSHFLLLVIWESMCLHFLHFFLHLIDFT